MPALLNTDPRFSSRQELLDLQDYPPDGDPGVDSQSHSPIVSSPSSPQSVGADGSASSAVFTGATSFQGQFCEQLCGWGTLRPRALQVFNTPPWALLFLSVAALLQGMVINGFTSASLTSIERRFDLSSTQTGLIVSCYDIASCICLPFVSYFGENGHKPRWLGWGIGIIGLGSLVFALPHFTTPPYQVTVPERSYLCSSNTTDFSENKTSDGLSNYFYVFVLGQLLHGIGATPLFTLGFTFLDDIVRSNNSPLYMGIFYTASVFGPLIGMQLGGYFLGIYSEITMETELTPASPLWVGAWWIGFILAGTLSLIVALLILGYPKKLPGSNDSAASLEYHHCKDGHHSTSNQPFGKRLTDMPRSLLLLLRIPTFIFLCLAVTAVNGQIASLSGFSFKFFESQFSLTSSDAALFLGSMVIPAALGAFLGSFFVKRFQLKCRDIIRFCIACSFVGVLLYLMFLIHCPNVSMAGVTVPYASDQLNQDVFEEGWISSDEYGTLQGLTKPFLNDVLMAQCNANCSCDRQLFNPVCGADDITYYSPCYAGCTSINLTGIGEVYTDCSCVRGIVSPGQEGLAVTGKCVRSCPYMAVFMTIFAISTLCNGLYIIPPITVILRCVPEKQKSFALGIQWILVRTLGAIPGPIVFGSLMDQACLLRQSEDQGSCYLYENSQMSHFTLLNCAIYRGSGTVFFILALVFLKAPAESSPVRAESTDTEAEDRRSLHNKTLPKDGTMVIQQTRL